jgi:excisionase family DNA binding protein
MISATSAVEIYPADTLFDNLVWMTSEEAATYLRTTVGALRTAVCRGQIRARKWRRRLYFKKMELDLLLESSRRTS